jgi:L-histidine N-alpha-methyltransferase
MNKFLSEVISDLGKTPKQLSSKYFYNDRGDRLFQQIMKCPEYYPTRAEMEIFSEQSLELAEVMINGFTAFALVELGAGDASKTTHLLAKLLDLKVEFTYAPIDISGATINYLTRNLPENLPGLKLKGFNGEYFDMLRAVDNQLPMNKSVLMLGGNIGNDTPENALIFCKTLRNSLRKGDRVLIGFDLKKNPAKILAAYNDAQGLTRDFNLNLLVRINQELDGDFEICQFTHYASYDPTNGACKSFLVSLADQEVHIGGVSFQFKKDESVFMEISQKYTVDEIERLAISSSFRPVKNFYDRNKWFVDTVWECV